MQQSWGFRAARAAMFAAICVLLAALGHVLMSGTTVPWWAMAMALAWIGVTAWIVADRERGVLFVVLGTVVAQAALHIVFTLAQSIAHPAGAAPSVHNMEHDAMPVAAHSANHQMTGTASVGMFAAHLLAALLCGLWLAYGERAAFAVLRSVAGRVLLPLLLLSRPQATEHRQRIRPSHSLAPFCEFLLVHAITSRGPPRGFAVS